MARDAQLISQAFDDHDASLSGLTVRLAEARDTPVIAAIEARHFDALRRGPQHLGVEYDAALFCENRQGWVLRAVAEDARGIVGYGIAQIRARELYLFEVCADGGAGKPGHDLFYTLVHAARLLGLPHVTTALSRPDRMRALARGHRRVGMRPSPVRGFSLTGERLPSSWTWLQGDVREILDISTRHQMKKEALDHG
jgi:hypothetical protein